MTSKSKKQRNQLALQNANNFLHRIGRDAYLDWQLSVALAFIVGLALVAVGVVAFRGVEEISKTAPARTKAGAAQKLVFDTAALHSVLGAYDDRASETRDLKGGYSGTTDPSQ